MQTVIASMNVPKMSPKMWKNEETMYRCFREMDRASEFSSRNMRNLVNRMRSVEVADMRCNTTV